MTIKELSSKANNRYITVTFQYEEVKDMANGLYYVSKNMPEYKEIKNKCKFLFDMIKEGMIQSETISGMSEDIKKEEKINEL